MKRLAFAVLVSCAFTGIQAAAPKTDVVIETTEGILLHSEYVSENDKVGVIDVRAALMPPNLCEEKDFPKYIPKGKLKNPTKMTSGHCLYAGKPFILRSINLEAGQIKKRYDTALITLSANSEKKQVPFYGTSGKSAWGFNLSTEPVAGGGQAPAVGLQAFPMDKTMDTIQTVTIAGERDSLYPHHNLFHKWSKLDPRIGLVYTPLLPTADISLLKFGVVGFTVENSIAIPEMKFMPLKKHNLRLRGGINAGFHSFSQDLYQNGEAVSTGSITLIPVLFQLSLYWDLKPKSMNLTISPYVKLADGIIFSSVSTAVKSQYVSLLAAGAESSRSGSYIGNGFQAVLGVEFRPAKWPVAFFVDGGYMMHSQDVSGQYFLFNLGAAWHYGSTPPEPKMLPISYLGAKSVVLILKGTVKEPDGDALTGAMLTLRAKGSTAIVKQVTANDKGQYSLDLEPGLDYTVEATRDGYAKSTLDLPMLSNDKKTRDHDFILAPMTYSLEGVNFKPDSDELIKGKAPEKALNELVKFLQSNPGIKIEIGGHTAASGTDDASSRALSKKRAESVRKFIISKGIDGGRLASEGYGGSAPIADGKTAAGAAKNRRVEVKILLE